MKSRLFKITSFLVSLISISGCFSVANATKLNAPPLPSERDLKDFEDSQTTVPDVSRFSRRVDYREAERLKKEQAEKAKKDAVDRAAQQEKDMVSASKKNIQAALEANNRGVALGKQGHWVEAITAQETACQLEPQNKQYRINLSAARTTFGQARLTAKDYGAAAGLFRKALVAAPDNGLATKLLNETMKKQGHDPSVVEERVAIGDQLLAGNDLESALVEFQTALQLESSARTFCKMGDVALRCGQYQTAANWYRQALVKDADFAPAHRQMGFVQMQLRDQTGAAASLRKAIILDSKDSVAGQMLVEIWRRQVAANPLLAENHLGLAGALQLTGDFNAADDEYNKLKALEPSNPGLAAGLASLGRARQHAMSEKHKAASETLFSQGLRREALGEIGQAVMMEPKNARYQFLLGECLEANGDLNGAHQAYMTAVLIDPEKNKEAAFRLKEMQGGRSLNMAPQGLSAMPLAMPQSVMQQMRQVMPPQMAQPAQTQQIAQQQIAQQQPAPPHNFNQIPQQKNMFEGGSGLGSAVSKTQMGFSTHDESGAQGRTGQAEAAQSNIQTEDVAKLTALESAKDYAGSANLLRGLLQTGTNVKNADIHHRLAVDLLATGNVTEAISEFRIASALKPESKDFASDLGQALEIHKRSHAFDDGNVASSTSAEQALAAPGATALSSTGAEVAH